jgi:transglutaminase-like putative cysteine protease
MKFRIYHQTGYHFSEKIFLEPHIFRFKPRQDHKQRLTSFALTIEPVPTGRNEFLDETNNLSELIWFDGKHAQLNLTAVSELETTEKNPFDFLIYPFSFNQMPVHYDLSFALSRYLYISDNQKSINSFIKSNFNDFTGTVMEYLLLVTHKIYEDFEKTIRHNGPPHPPDITLREKKGSCRDLAVLEMEILRNAGFATRFVSGYKFNPDPAEESELHAWVEVFLPGPGWIGFDPSTGLIAGNDHFPVVSSYLPEKTMPVTGTFRGSASSAMKSEIRIEQIRS